MPTERKRICKSALVGSFAFGVGFGLLNLLATQTSLGPMYANFVLMVPMGAFGFWLNRRFPFKDRNTELKRTSGRYAIGKAALTLVSQGTYLVAVCLMGCPLTIVQPVKTVAMAPISYAVNNSGVFTPRQTDPE